MESPGLGPGVGAMIRLRPPGAGAEAESRQPLLLLGRGPWPGSRFVTACRWEGADSRRGSVRYFGIAARRELPPSTGSIPAIHHDLGVGITQQRLQALRREMVKGGQARGSILGSSPRVRGIVEGRSASMPKYGRTLARRCGKAMNPGTHTPSGSVLQPGMLRSGSPAPLRFRSLRRLVSSARGTRLIPAGAGNRRPGTPP